MKKFKEGAADSAREVSREDLALINALSKKELTEQEIFTFSMTLCDNDVDRDFERFDIDALEKLAGLFVGRTGISDHEWASARQVARIYKTQVVCVPEKTTAAGEEYVFLKAWAYMLRTDENRSLITEIEGGIKKETSVGCSVGRSTCSICGAPSGQCGHVKGKSYGGKLCHAVLGEVTDAYEWSFVAVPAQRAAGVTKAFRPGENTGLGSFVESEAGCAFAGEFKQLVSLAQAGKRYENFLREQTRRLCLLCDRQLFDAISRSMESMDCEQLESLRDCLEKKAGEILPVKTQLPGMGDVVQFDGGDYKI